MKTRKHLGGDMNKIIIPIIIVIFLIGIVTGAYLFSTHIETMKYECNLDEICKDITGFQDAMYSDGYCYYTEKYQGQSNSNLLWWNSSWSYRTSRITTEQQIRELERFVNGWGPLD